MSRAKTSYARIRSGVRGVETPPLVAGSAAPLAALLGQLDRSQWLEPAILRSRQFRQLRTLAEHCAAHSPYFARRLAAAGLSTAELATERGLARLAPLRRHDVQSAPDLFCNSIPPEHAPVQEARTSGSTGEPVCVRRTAITHLMWTAHLLRDQIWHGRDFTARQCAIRANIDEAKRLPDWGGAVGTLFETGEVLAVPIVTPIAELLSMIDAFRPQTLLA